VEEARSKVVIKEKICDEGRCKEKSTLRCQTTSCGTNPQCPKGYDRILDSDKYICPNNQAKKLCCRPQNLPLYYDYDYVMIMLIRSSYEKNSEPKPALFCPLFNPSTNFAHLQTLPIVCPNL
jgi:hypothetical protein